MVSIGPRSADMSGVWMSYFGSLAVTNTASIWRHSFRRYLGICLMVSCDSSTRRRLEEPTPSALRALGSRAPSSCVNLKWLPGDAPPWAQARNPPVGMTRFTMDSGLASRAPEWTADKKADSLKFVTNPKPSANCSGKSRAALNLCFIASCAPSCPRRGRLGFQCPFPDILPTPDRRCSYCCLLRTPISWTAKPICGSTDLCTRAPFMRLGRRKPGRKPSFALRAMSRLPFASGKYSPCSSPTNAVAASALLKLARPSCADRPRLLRCLHTG
jgi:hypothetical protein